LDVGVSLADAAAAVGDDRDLEVGPAGDLGGRLDPDRVAVVVDDAEDAAALLLLLRRLVRRRGAGDEGEGECPGQGRGRLRQAMFHSSHRLSVVQLVVGNDPGETEKRKLRARYRPRSGGVEAERRLVGGALWAAPSGGAAGVRRCRRLLSRAVPLDQELPVVQLVAGDDPGEGTDRNFVSARHPTPGPRLRGQAAEQGDRRIADRVELTAEVGERACTELRWRYVGVLIERGEGRRVAAGKSERTVDEDALGVADMADDLLDRPLPGRVGMVPARLGDRLEQAGKVRRLPLELRDDAALGDEGDVGGVVS